MKRFKKVKSLLFGFALTLFFGFVNTDVYAKTVTPDEIQGSTYVIGTHVFTREVNETTGYEGRLTTNLIMLASQTIGSNDLDSMIIYYKTASGMWIDGLTGNPIEVPESFEIDYTNIQLEEINNTVTAPKAPILDLNGGMLYIDKKTDMLLYQVNVYIDDVDNKLNKTDGVELNIQNGGKMTKEDLKFGDDFTTITTVLDSYEGDKLIKGKQYHSDFISIEMPANDCYYYYVSARSYVVDGNGKKTYSDFVTISVGPKNIAALEIVNNYSNPDYVGEYKNYYMYNLGIKKPNDYVFKIEEEKFAYKVTMTGGNLSEVGIFGLDEMFTISVPKGREVRLRAQLGYYDINGDFWTFSSETSKEFVIDTRTLTAPVLVNYAHRDYVGPASTPSSIANGEYIHINKEFYEKQEKNTLDYQIEGAEIYRLYLKSVISSADTPAYELISTDGFEHVFPPDGGGFYTARVYATNALGEKVYSDFSDFVGVVRTPLISASEVVDGKVTVTIENIDEYMESNLIDFTLYTKTDEGEVELANSFGNKEKNVFEIEATENMEIYAVASMPDWVHSTPEEHIDVYSRSSNGIDIIVK